MMALAPGDECTASCQVAYCGDQVLRNDITQPNVEGFEECDDGNDSDNDACTTGCRTAVCGDGYVRLGLSEGEPGYEGCDDANEENSDGCLSGCRRAQCGDGILRMDLAFGEEGYEECDDGNQANEDACLANGTQHMRRWFLGPNEACDDGNDNERMGAVEIANFPIVAMELPRRLRAKPVMTATISTPMAAPIVANSLHAVMVYSLERSRNAMTAMTPMRMLASRTVSSLVAVTGFIDRT